MTKKKVADNLPVNARYLYVGTSEEKAKLAPVYGLNSPVILTDVYCGQFAKLESTNRWGIIKVNIEALFPVGMAPFHYWLERKYKKAGRKDSLEERLQHFIDNIDDYQYLWEKSLDECGVCLYMIDLPIAAIDRISIYDPVVRTKNKFISDSPNVSNPYHIHIGNHKKNYRVNHCLTRWLMGEAVTGEDWSDNMTDSIKISEKLGNRQALDIFYQKPDKTTVSWWRKSS